MAIRSNRETQCKPESETDDRLIDFQSETRSWGAHPPRVWLDAPRVQCFGARRWLERSKPSCVLKVFREGAKNGTRGACAPHLNFDFRVQIG